MVRLVVLKLLLVSLLLTGCSMAPVNGPRSAPGDAGNDSLPYQQSDGVMGPLDSGQHHPAVQALLTRAEQARRQRQWPIVMSYLDQARQIQPRDAGIWYRQGWVKLQQGDTAQAEQLLKRGLLFSQSSVTTARLRQLLEQISNGKSKPL